MSNFVNNESLLVNSNFNPLINETEKNYQFPKEFNMEVVDFNKNNKKIAVYGGSFDPITKGHLFIIERASLIFDKIHVIVASNSKKDSLFSISEREYMIAESCKELNLDISKIKVNHFTGLITDYAKEIKANAIIRGLRAMSDFDYEFQMALLNRKLYPDIETFFIVTRNDMSYISSSTVKELYLKFNTDVSSMATSVVISRLNEKKKALNTKAETLDLLNKVFGFDKKETD